MQQCFFRGGENKGDMNIKFAADKQFKNEIATPFRLPYAGKKAILYCGDRQSGRLAMTSLCRLIAQPPTPLIDCNLIPVK